MWHNSAGLSSKETYILVNFPATDLIYFTTPICPLINLSLMSMLLISLTLALIFSSNLEERFPVPVVFVALKETRSSSDKVIHLGKWSIASIEFLNHGIIVISYKHILCKYMQNIYRVILFILIYKLL